MELAAMRAPGILAQLGAADLLFDGVNVFVAEQFLGNLRAKMVKNEGIGKDWFESLLAEGILDSIKEKNKEKVKKTVQKITGEEVEVEFN